MLAKQRTLPSGTVQASVGKNDADDLNNTAKVLPI